MTPFGAEDSAIAKATPPSLRPNPPKIRQAIDLFFDVVRGCDDLHAAMECLRSLLTQNGGEYPTDYIRYLERDGDDDPDVPVADWERWYARMKKQYRRWDDARDKLKSSVQRWRAANDAARAILPEIAAKTDREGDPDIELWSTLADQDFGELGSVCNRFTDGDEPSSLDASRLKTLMRVRNRMQKRINQLKSIREPVAKPDLSWARSLAVIGRQFEADRSRFPDFRHGLIVVRDDDRERLMGPPRVVDVKNGMHIRHGSRTRPVFKTSLSSAGSRSTVWRGDAFEVIHPPLAKDNYFGCRDDLESAKAAIEAFGVLARRAWASVPEAIRSSLVAEPNLVPSERLDDESKWVLLLYVVAWTMRGAAVISADRHICPKARTQAHQQREAEINIESLCHPLRPLNNDPVLDKLFKPLSPVEEIKKHHPSLDPDDIDRIGVPPTSFWAFLEPDLFLASRLAIDAILTRFAPGLVESPDSSPTGPPGAAAKADGWTKDELCKAGEIGGTTFDRIREEATLRRKAKSGEHGFRFSYRDVQMLAKAAREHSAGKRKWRKAADHWSAMIKEIGLADTK